jgi:hypothetical protein
MTPLLARARHSNWVGEADDGERFRNSLLYAGSRTWSDSPQPKHRAPAPFVRYAGPPLLGGQGGQPLYPLARRHAGGGLRCSMPPLAGAAEWQVPRDAEPRLPHGAVR